jgi:hypothetical protein
VKSRYMSQNHKNANCSEKNLLRLFAASLITFILCFSLFPGDAFAAFRYNIPKQQDQLTINEDGSVDLVRYFEFAVDLSSSDSGTEIWIGLPTSNTRVSSVTDDDGNKVKHETRFSGGDYTLILTGFTGIKPGTAKGFTVEATIPDFIFRDSQNEGYATMKYIPGWWSSEVEVQDIAVILPGGIEEDEIKTGSRQWDGIAQTESGAYVVTWHFENLAANERVAINIGIPDTYVAVPAKEEPVPVVPPEHLPSHRIPGIGQSRDFGMIFGLVVIVMMVMIVAGISSHAREDYSSPQLSMEGVGVNETLSPVESSVLLRQPPEKTMTLLLFSLIKKGIVRAYSTEPLKLSVQYERDLSELEKLFIEAINRDTGKLDQSKLIAGFRYLATSVNEKMKPYCRKDTEAFYRGHIARLWAEVKEKNTPELKLESLDKNLLWLMQDEKNLKESEGLFDSRQRGTAWWPNWWLTGLPIGRAYHGGYWWPMAMYHSYSGISTGIIQGHEEKYREITESVFTPASPAPARSIFSGNRSGHSGHGGFTPPSCACACACVSCACACACAGGGGCT